MTVDARTVLPDTEIRAFADLIPRADWVGKDSVEIAEMTGYPANEIRAILAAVAVTLQGLRDGLKFRIDLDPEALQPSVSIGEGMVSVHDSSPEIISLVQCICERRGYATTLFHTGTILYIWAPEHWPSYLPPDLRNF